MNCMAGEIGWALKMTYDFAILACGRKWFKPVGFEILAESAFYNYCLAILLLAIPAYYLFIYDSKHLQFTSEDLKMHCYQQIRSSLDLVPCAHEVLKTDQR